MLQAKLRQALGADVALPRGVRGFLFKSQLPRLAPLLDALEAVGERRQLRVQREPLVARGHAHGQHLARTEAAA